MSLWIRDGKLLVGESGKPVDCSDCPCDPPPSSSGSASGTDGTDGTDGGGDCEGCSAGTSLPATFVIDAFVVANLGCDFCTDANNNRTLYPATGNCPGGFGFPITSVCQYRGNCFTICSDVDPGSPEGGWYLWYDIIDGNWYLRMSDTSSVQFSHIGQMDCDGPNVFTQIGGGSECIWPAVLTVRPGA